MDENKNEYLGTLTFLGQDEAKNFYVQVDVVRSGPNRNGWDFQNMEQNCKSFLGTPLLCAYLPNQIGDGHNFREKTLPTGEQILDFTGPTAERIVGAISDDPDDVWTEEREDGVWTVAKGKIWRFYNRQLVDRLAMQGSMSVSAEIETFGGRVDEDGIEVYDNWVGLGVTLLHESVPPAVPGAHIRAIKAMSEEFNELKLKAASYNGEDEEDDGVEQEHIATLETEPESEQTPKRKGVKASMSMNRREAERLAPKFEGYQIVGLSEDSKHVILMTDNCALYSYKFSEEYGEGVVPEAIMPVKNVVVTCSMDEEDGVTADLDDIIKNLTAVNAENGETIKNLNAEIAKLNSELEGMKTAEHDRRVEAVKDAVSKTLADIAESCDNAAENCDNEAEAILANAEDYAQMETEGKFCGAEKARAALMAAYAEKHMQVEKDKTRKSYAWNRSEKNDNHSDDNIADLLARING